MSDRTAKLARLEELLGPALDDRLSGAEARELEMLLADDPEAQRAYLRRFQLHAMLTEERSILGHFEDGDAADNLIELPVRRRASASREASRASRSGLAARLRSWARPLAVGAVGVAAGIVATVWVNRAGPDGPAAGQQASALPLVREASLADGSVVQLAPRSTVELRFTASERALELQDGEAHFSVARDPGRPFVVAAGNVRVRAIGTAFDVRRAGERVVVTVTEGKVEVYEEAAQKVHAVAVQAGSRVLFDRREASRGPVLSSVDVAQTLAWRDGRLLYSREPLRAVIADLNRYSDRPIAIADGAVEELRVTGTVLTRATAAWLESLPGSLPVRVSLEDERWVIRATTRDAG